MCAAGPWIHEQQGLKGCHFSPLNLSRSSPCSHWQVRPQADSNTLYRTALVCQTVSHTATGHSCSPVADKHANSAAEAPVLSAGQHRLEELLAPCGCLQQQRCCQPELLEQLDLACFASHGCFVVTMMITGLEFKCDLVCRLDRRLACHHITATSTMSGWHDKLLARPNIAAKCQRPGESDLQISAFLGDTAGTMLREAAQTSSYSPSAARKA